MNSIVKDMMDFIPKYVKNGGGIIFNSRKAFYEYTGQTNKEPFVLKVGDTNMWQMGTALRELKKQGKIIRYGRSSWKWIGD